MNAKRKWLLSGSVLGGLLTLGPFLGILGTVFGIQRAFKQLGHSGIQDPHALSSSIGEALVSTSAGLIVCPLGMILFGLSLYGFFHQPPANTVPPPLPK